MRIGFLRLLDAAPLIMAGHLGYFTAAGVSASLHRQTGWMNARDQLLAGFLDASQAPIGMPIMSQTGRAGFEKPLVAVMNLGTGGNVFVLSSELARAGVDSITGLADFVRSRTFYQVLNRTLIGSYVSTYSGQYYLLRNWLEAAGLSENRHIRLTPLMPAQVPEHLAHGYVDVCCIGEPWGTRCVSYGWGTIIGATTDVLPHHPEKVLAFTEQFTAAHPQEVTGAVEAVLRGADFCSQSRNMDTLVEVLSHPAHLDESPDIIRRSLMLGVSDAFPTQGREGSGDNGTSPMRPADAVPVRSWNASDCYPDSGAMEWFLGQMVRWHDLVAGPELQLVARRSVRTDFFEQAAARLGLPPTAPEASRSLKWRNMQPAGTPIAV